MNHNLPVHFFLFFFIITSCASSEGSLENRPLSKDDAASLEPRIIYQNEKIQNKLSPEALVRRDRLIEEYKQFFETQSINEQHVMYEGLSDKKYLPSNVKTIMQAKAAKMFILPSSMKELFNDAYGQKAKAQDEQDMSLILKTEYQMNEFYNYDDSSKKKQFTEEEILKY
jgi:hypothetical protein